MKRIAAVVVAVGLMGGVIGCGGDSSSSDEDQIQELADSYSQAALDGDYAAACETFSREAIARIEELSQFDGCEDFASVGLGTLTDEQKAELSELSDIQVDGDTATAEGRDGTVTFVKEDGEWKASLDE